MLSIRQRLVPVTLGTLLLFLGATGVVLEQAFKQSQQQALRDRLLTQVYAVLAGAELKNGELLVENGLPDPRFSTPGSGLYAAIYQRDKLLWRSDSMLAVDLAAAPSMQPGQLRYDSIDQGGDSLAVIDYGLSWQEPEGALLVFTVRVAETNSQTQHTVAAFRKTLFWGLGGAGLALLITQWLALRWSLRPLNKVADDLAAMETGENDTLPGPYAKELRGLTDNLNRLVSQERERTRRYRNHLGDLAHSLKTPIAVLKTGIEERPDDKAGMLEQLDRMDQIVRYQLQRASASASSTPLGRRVEVAPVVARLADVMHKVHGDKALRIDTELADISFRGMEDDLMELVGNLLDNACKWARRRVAVTARVEAAGWLLRVEDDGPGFTAPTESLIQRGVRADQNIPGTGLGLAMVHDLVSSYGGQLSLGRSETLGGAMVDIRFP